VDPAKLERCCQEELEKPIFKKPQYY